MLHRVDIHGFQVKGKAEIRNCRLDNACIKAKYPTLMPLSSYGDLHQIQEIEQWKNLMGLFFRVAGGMVLQMGTKDCAPRFSRRVSSLYI